jgi:alpha-beta hydrolase superfamily lysophospholipase
VEYWKQTQDDSFRAFLDMVALDLPKPEKVKTPLLVLGAARDNMIGPREVEATARAYDTHAEIIPHVAHNSMLERNWQSVAQRILVWLEERNLQGPNWRKPHGNSNPLEIESSTTYQV